MRKLIRRWIRMVQSFLLVVFLTILYVVGFGLTYLFAVVFKRRLVTARARRGSSTYFVEARDYDIETESARRAS